MRTLSITFILLFACIFFITGCQDTSSAISKDKAIEIASLTLIGKPSFSDDVPVDVDDRGETYIVFFTFPVPEGGGTYQSYVIVDKSSGEALEFGVLEPGQTR